MLAIGGVGTVRRAVKKKEKARSEAKGPLMFQLTPLPSFPSMLPFATRRDEHGPPRTRI